ncbi:MULTISPECIES: GNAT family N-acetyltransferase [Corynebacterium]|uniref:Acetyltransferase (GNAT) domain n=1 Tax=Corynebacterium singulare TaxID=161899 RepID=A0A0B6F210_9CORY|nr:hypothetical protein [Corynebacterium singulare]AJI78490.1 Acetyltransferase (GNAT) domain [Corynebacterium singulare]
MRIRTATDSTVPRDNIGPQPGFPENTASIKLHEKFGFATVGTFKKVTCKAGRWPDLTHLQLMV